MGGGGEWGYESARRGTAAGLPGMVSSSAGERRGAQLPRPPSKFLPRRREEAANARRKRAASRSAGIIARGYFRECSGDVRGKIEDWAHLAKLNRYQSESAFSALASASCSASDLAASSSVSLSPSPKKSL